MVLGLIQQRDMYRAMVEESDRGRQSLSSPTSGRQLAVTGTAAEATPQKYKDLQISLANVRAVDAV
jgi:hypothetical protein